MDSTSKTALLRLTQEKIIATLQKAQTMMMGNKMWVL